MKVNSNLLIVIILSCSLLSLSLNLNMALIVSRYLFLINIDKKIIKGITKYEKKAIILFRKLDRATTQDEINELEQELEKVIEDSTMASDRFQSRIYNIENKLMNITKAKINTNLSFNIIALIACIALIALLAILKNNSNIKLLIIVLFIFMAISHILNIVFIKKIDNFKSTFAFNIIAILFSVIISSIVLLKLFKLY
jgi:hypothetical protein